MLIRARPYLIVLAILAVFLVLSVQEDSLFRKYEGAVAAFSLLLAIVFAFDAKADASRVSESISTRYVGQFPQNLRNLTSLVRKAKKSFFAYADCVDYGSFFEPLEFENFLTAVRRRSDAGVKFTFLVLGKPQDISGASGGGYERYVPTYCEVLRSNADFMSALPQLFDQMVSLSKRGIIDCPEDVTLDQVRSFLVRGTNYGVDKKVLSALLLCFHEWTRQKLEEAHADIIVKHEEQAPKFFFWMSDEEEAMFELLRPTNNALGFTTRDTNLVDSLTDIWYQAIE